MSASEPSNQQKRPRRSSLPARTTPEPAMYTMISAAPSLSDFSSAQMPEPQSPTNLDPYPSNSSSSDDEQNSDLDQNREIQSIREVDAGSIVAPPMSRTQTRVLYNAAHSPNHGRSDSVSTDSDEDGAETQPVNVVVREATPPDASAGPRAARTAPASTTAGSKPSGAGKGPKRTLTSKVKNAQKQRLSNFSMPNISLPSLPNVSLPNVSLPNMSLPSFMSGNARFSGIMEKGRKARTYTLQLPKHEKHHRREGAQGGNANGNGNLKVPTGQQGGPGTIRPLLRRVSSDGALSPRLTRMASYASTIDDSKFENVQHMTNSRLKAIKDNIRAGLPTIPQLPYIQQQWSSISLNPFADDKPQKDVPRVPRESHAMDALDTLTGDVVVMGGYRGSILRNRANGKRVWVPFKVSLNLQQIDLEVPLDEDADEKMESKIYADGMLQHIGPVDISRRLIRRLQNNSHRYDRRVHDFGYDWRLSPALLVSRLIDFLSTLPCNLGTKPRGATVIAHSLGGLIVRSAINQRPELFSGVLFAGTPAHCVNILGPLRNGDSVLFNSKVFTAQVNFTLRTSFAFLPDDGRCFIDKRTGREINLDFFDPRVWREFGLSPVVSDVAHPENTHSPLIKDRSLAPQMGGSAASQSQTVTLPRDKANAYLERVLKQTRAFRESMKYRPELERRYPPMAVLYAKTTPTVRGARVDGREGIKRDDVYDELVFGAGDGVALARAAMLPEGYTCVRKVAVDRGHLSLLGDLEGVGECVRAIREARGW